jgi:hypothetical protein
MYDSSHVKSHCRILDDTDHHYAHFIERTEDNALAFCFLYKDTYAYMVVVHLDSTNTFFDISLSVAHQGETEFTVFDELEWETMSDDLKRYIVKSIYFIQDFCKKEFLLLQKNKVDNFHDDHTYNLVQSFWN